MRKTLTLISVRIVVTCLAQEQSIPTRRIVPGDIEKHSIHLVRFSTNSFGVRWTYTETGAKSMLAFNEAHEGKKARTVIGEWEGPPGVEVFRPIPPVFTNYVQWKEGWVKYRTDKVVGMSEVDARRIVAGLRGK